MVLDNTGLTSLQNIQIDPQMTLPPSATTEVNFTGNLDSFQQPNVLELLNPQGFTLPIGLAIAANAPPFTPGLNWAIDTNRLTVQGTPDGGFELKQVNDLATYVPGGHNPPEAMENGYINLGAVKLFAGNYAWEQQPPIPPARQCSETVYDSTGNQHTITVQFYQVNDLGANGVNPSPGPSQVCYAWYAFDTTGGAPVSTADLLGGTGIGEGDFFNDLNPFFSYDRGIAGQGNFGDFLWFNSDGSLASTGGVVGIPGPAGLNFNWQDLPRIYLPAVNFNPPRSPIPTRWGGSDGVRPEFRDGGLIARTGETIGVNAFIEKDLKAVFNNGLIRVIVNVKKCIPKYLYYVLQSQDFKGFVNNHFRSTSTQPNMKINVLLRFPIPLPNLVIQEEIADLLSAYDDLIENNRRRIKILEEIARSLYREWFVYFRYPGNESVPLVNSQLGLIPRGWGVKKLEDVLELNYGKALKHEDRNEGVVPVYGSSGVVGYHNVSLVKGPGIIVGRKGNVGSVFWSDNDFYPIDTAYFVSSSLPLRFLFYDLKTQNFISNDAAVPGLNRNQAYSLGILLPTSNLINGFCEFANDFESQVLTHQNQIDNLRQTRDLLLFSFFCPDKYPSMERLRRMSPSDYSEYQLVETRHSDIRGVCVVVLYRRKMKSLGPMAP